MTAGSAAMPGAVSTPNEASEVETAKMETVSAQSRALGKTGMRTPPLAFGGNVFGWTADERTSHALLHAFVGAGFNPADTADMYSTWVPGHAAGEPEPTIARWTAPRGQRAPPRGREGHR